MSPRMSLRKMVMVGLIGVSAITGGCKKAAPGGVHLDEVRAAFADSGWKTDSFQPIDPQQFSAQKCVTGKIEQIDAVLCEYGSTEAVRQGKRGAEAWVATAVTGAALDNGRTVLALADRARTDPNGKTIHRITKAYRDAK